ncbi:hypothetical protein HDU98_001869 [Podochytrium sp. JEL0797]|nr:hypothetical protein HDU98_001869 [Podochytrium sp. JEL0797]
MRLLLSLLLLPFAIAAHASTSTAVAMTNNGGPIIPNVLIKPIYFGDVKYANELDTFYTHIASTSWFSIMSQYGVYGGTAVPGIRVRSSPTALTNKQVQALLLAMAAKGDIVPTKNSYFPIHFSPGYVITDDSGAVSCKQWCGIHHSISLKGVPGVPELYYGMIPNFGKGSGCDANCGTGSELQNILSTASHELAEAVTDPSDLNLAWYDETKNLRTGDAYGEIADVCNQ